MREFGSVREFFTASTIGTIADIPFILIFLLLVASIGGNLVWILVIGGALMVLPGFLFQKRMIALTQATQGASNRAAKLLYEAVYEQETVNTQRGEDRFQRLWAELVTLSAVKSSEQRKLSSALTYWAQGVQQATYVMAVVAGAFMVFAGDFTMGTIIAIGILTGRTLGPLAQLSATLARWTNVKAALQGLDAVAEAEQAADEGRKYLRRERLKGAFEMRLLEFRYAPDLPATVEIQGCSIPAGQHVAVLGTNGSGKSTLLRIMAGLYEPTAGRILLDNVDMGQIHPRDLRRGIGYLGQDVRLFSGTIRDNLNMNLLERDDERLFAALDFAGLGQFVRNHPRGLDLEIRELGEGLSVGQRQSLGWARLWLQDPSIVLLDEPTAALDQTLEATLVSRLAGWLEGRTAVIATHRVPILQLTTRTLILQNGRLAVDGPREAVLAHLSKAQAAAGGSGA
jgi:ATP-binding cassette subfamily C protein LapB